MYFPKLEQQQQQQQQQVHAFLSKTKEITPLKFSRLQLSLVALVVAHLTHLTMSKRATRHRDWGYLRMETKVCYILAGSIYEYSKPCHWLGDFPVFKTANLDHFSPAWVPHSTCSDTITDPGLWSNLNRHILHWRPSAHDLKCLYHVYVHIHIYTYIHIIISISVTSKSIILSSVSPPTKKRATFLGIHHFWTNSKEIFMAPIFFDSSTTLFALASLATGLDIFIEFGIPPLLELQLLNCLWWSGDQNLRNALEKWETRRTGCTSDIVWPFMKICWF